jgi:GLPGLI family protein
MNKLFAIIFFFKFNINSAQTIEFKYEYRLNYKEIEKKFGDFLNKNTDEFSKNMVNNLIKLYEFYQDNVYHTVIYENSKSISFVNQILPPDTFNEFQRNFIKSEINKIFFKDFSDSTYIKHESFLGKRYNIVTKDHKWKITTESKTIQDYVCYKVISENNPEIIAWFTSDLPYKIGPSSFFGLPGVVMEVHFGYLSFICTKIKTENVNADLIKIPKGIHITGDEMKKISGIAKNNLRN